MKGRDIESLFNCRVLVLNRKVLLIRPKISLCNDGNYREKRHELSHHERNRLIGFCFRYYTAWKAGQLIHDYRLPSLLDDVCTSVFCPFGKENVSSERKEANGKPMVAGEAVLCFKDSTVGCEICEELFTPEARIYQLRLMGVDLISNGSGSLHEVRKIDMRLEHIFHATKRVILFLDAHGGRSHSICHVSGVVSISMPIRKDVMVVISTTMVAPASLRTERWLPSAVSLEWMTWRSSRQQ